MLKWIVLIITVQLFWGFSVTMLAYALPTDVVGAQSALSQYAGTAADFDQSLIAANIRENIQSQMQLSFVDIGALVYYSGNLVIDIIVNFFTAVPSMITLAINSYFMVFPIDAQLQAGVLQLIWVLASILYFVAFLSFIMQLRSGQSGGGFV
jgi:hypothetical protein